MDDEKNYQMWINLFPTICILSLISSAGGVLCPAGCKCENEILRANCSGAGIQVVPIQLNPELHIMDLSHNKISQLHFSFQFYEKLHSLDVSSNKVRNIGSENFKIQKNLKFFNLSDNIIDSLGKDTFRGLVELTELDLSKNQLTTLESTAFKHLHNLTILRLNANQLDSIEEDTFKETPYLVSLYMDDNSFIALPTELSYLTKLKFLSMARNLIVAMEDDKVPILQELEALVLVENQIQEIQPRGLADMPKLNHLDLSDNDLDLLPTAQLSKLSKLVNLKLSGNTFNFLPPVAFRGLFHLKYLTINRLEHLESIDSRAFVDNINLEKISMDYNYKTISIPTRLFHGNPKLRYISIRYNSIKFFVATHFPLDQLEELRVGGNPLDCNCSMGWLWRILEDNEHHVKSNGSHFQSEAKMSSRRTNDLRLDVDEIVCETPEDLHDKKLVRASQRQMDCSMSWLAIVSVSLTVIFILGIILGVLFCMPKKKTGTSMDKEVPRIIKTNYNPPPLPPPRKSIPYDINHVDRYIMPPILSQNRSMPMWDPYSQHCNGMGNIYEQLNDHRDRPHIVYV